MVEHFTFQSFLRGETQIPKDEAFKECIDTYLKIYLKSGETLLGIFSNSNRKMMNLFFHLTKIKTHYFLHL